jgi:hypothetical protein
VENGFVLHSFDVPTQGMVVQNIDTHKLIKNAFEFKFGDRLAFERVADDVVTDEEWEVKVDILNNLYIESSAGATVYVVVVGKMFYLTSFVGSQRSALYCFYLMSIQVPLCYEPNLQWSDQYPVSVVMNSLVRYASELLLVFKPQVSAQGSLSFKERISDANDFVITNTIIAQGSGLFSFYKRKLEGSLVVDQNGSIKEITVVRQNKSKIHVYAKTIEEKEQ